MQRYEILNQKQGEVNISTEVWRMQYLKYGDYYFMAVGEEHVKQVSLYNFQFGIRIVAIRNSEHGMLNMEEITEEDFSKAERRCRQMMFAARELFNPSKSLVE